MFTSYNGIDRNFIVRLHGGESAVTGLPADTFKKGVIVYPNPFTSEFSVKLPQIPVDQLQVLVRDISGRAVYSKAVITSEGQDLSVKLDDSLPKGVYLLQLRHGQEIGSYQMVKH